MADTSRSTAFSWPTGSWKVLQVIIRAWYQAENSGEEWTQRTVADLADVQPSRVSVNKGFLQAIGVVQTEGIALTEAGKSLGLGLSNETKRVVQQALQRIIRDNSILWPLLLMIRSRGTIDNEDFEAEVVQLTKQGKSTQGFTPGVGVLEDIFVESGWVEKSGNVLRPIKSESGEDAKEQVTVPQRGEQYKEDKSNKSDLRKIPIPVSASMIWYIEVTENPDPADIDKFIEMQRLIFGVQKS